MEIYGSSDAAWPYFTCATCGEEASDTDNNGTMVHGGYGSTRYDTSSLVWTVRGEDVYPLGYICDACIDRAVSDGMLEEFHNHFGDKDIGLNLSEAAYRELFAFGAREAYDEFWAKREDEPYEEAKDPSALNQAILDIRYRLSGDGVLASSFSMPRSRLGWTAVDIGYAHAVAAIAFGCGEADPSFEDAATAWAHARKALDAKIDEDTVNTEEMFEEMFRDAETERSTERGQ